MPIEFMDSCSKQEQAAQLIASMVRGLGGISSASMCIMDLLFKNQTLEKQGTKAKQVVGVGLRCLEPGHVKMMYHTQIGLGFVAQTYLELVGHWVRVKTWRSHQHHHIPLHQHF